MTTDIPGSHQGELHREVIKLLVQVAWADREIADEERDHILALARGAELHDDEIEDLRQALEHPEDLPAPDLALLKRFKQDVKRAALLLIRMDKRIADEEAAMLASIDALLDDE